jgi:hypothetical protein
LFSLLLVSPHRLQFWGSNPVRDYASKFFYLVYSKLYRFAI